MKTTGGGLDLISTEASEQRLQKLMLLTHTGVIQINASGHVLDANAPYLDLLGATTIDKIKGRSVFEWTVRDYIGEHAAAVQQCIQEGKILGFTTQLLTFSSDKVTVTIDAYVERVKEGIHIHAICRKISKQQLELSSREDKQYQLEAALEVANALEKSQVQLAKQAALLRSIIDSTPDLIFYKDHDGRFLGCNKAIEEFMKVKEKDLIGKTDYDFFDKETADAFRKNDQESIKANKTRINEEWVTYPDGRKVLLETLKTPYYGEGGKVLGMLGVSRNITERKNAEKKYQALAKEQSIIFNTTPVGIAYLKDDHFIRVNHHMIELFGWSEAEISEQTANSFYPPEGVFLDFGDEANPIMEKGEVYRVERIMRRKDRTYFWCHLSGQLIDINAPEKGSIWIFDNINQEKALRDSLQQAKEDSDQLKNLAEQANLAKSEFLANMSHELRTPMHAILSFSSIGLKNIEAEKHNKLEHYFLNINTSGKRLLFLLDDLLDLSKMEAGKMTYEFMPSDLQQTIESCINEQQARLEEVGLSITHQNANCDTRAEVDSARIGQVLTNLFSNAMKFTPPGKGITITATKDILYTESYTGPVPALKISICDEGLGIPEDEMEAVFDYFIQSSKTDTKSGGTGLGLAICRQIIEGHGGEIWAEKNPVGGTVVSFTIPVEQQDSRFVLEQSAAK